MKKFLPTLFAAVLVCSTALRAASFEGKVTSVISIPGKTEAGQEIHYSIKDSLLRMDMQVKDKSGKNAPPAVGVIIDSKKQEMTILMPQQQMYMVRAITAQDAQNAAQMAGGKGTQATLEKTGETETILGYKCEKYLVKSEQTVMSMWVTDQLGNFMSANAGAGFGGRGAPQAQAWEKLLEGKGMFPLRVIGSTAGGQENFRMDVTAVEKKSMSASEFVPPAGWKKFEMPNMGDMMKGLMPGMGR